MKAMIFAAGLGTRLMPLTSDKPKAMVSINGTPLIELIIRKMIANGVTGIVINVHHFADQVIDFLAVKENFGIDIAISDERRLLLNTGGGLKKAAPFFSDGKPFLVHNTDIISDLDFKKLYDFHLKNGALATLAVRHRPTSRYLLFDKKNCLRGWENIKTGEKIIKDRRFKHLRQLSFSGIHIINADIFNLMPNDDVFSIISVYLDAMQKNNIIGYQHDDDFWLDVGKKESLTRAADFLQKNEQHYK